MRNVSQAISRILKRLPPEPIRLQVLTLARTGGAQAPACPERPPDAWNRTERKPYNLEAIPYVNGDGRAELLIGHSG